MDDNDFWRLRPVEVTDQPLLVDLVVEAVNWTGERRVDAAAVQDDSHLAHYVSDWPQPADFGVVASDDVGRSLGAAWARQLPETDPGYGFVSADVPEVTVAVLPGHRGAGIGTALLEALIDLAEKRSLGALSLSVEDGNPVAGLYRRLGFQTVGR